MRHSPWQSLPIFLSLVLSAGCGRITRTKECRQLSSVVNESHAAVGVLADAAAPDEKAIAERYLQVAERVRGMEFSSPGLDKAAQDYATLMEDTGLTLDTDRPMPPRADGKPRPRPSLSLVPRRERTLVARINALCESP
jgi:hypothetical protein